MATVDGRYVKHAPVSVHPLSTPEQRFLIVVSHAAAVLWDLGLGDRLLRCLNELLNENSGTAATNADVKAETPS